MNYLAHKSEDGREQSISDHLKGTSDLAYALAVDEFKPFSGLLGMVHDIGKYADDFQKRINGSRIRYEHAVCGAIELSKIDADKAARFFIPMFEYCIAGHHTGLPDGGSDGSDEYYADLQGRLKRAKYYSGSADYSAYKNEIEINIPDTSVLLAMLTKDVDTKKSDRHEITERYAFFTRYLFSCLTDADFLDTERFFLPNIDRKLKADFAAVSKAVDHKLDVLKEMKADTELQRSRRRLLEQAVGNSVSEENIYLLNMPTGSGKTLCSLKTALDMLERSNGKLKRIIYVIPYTSIIEQTADEFSNLFGDHADILQHHSNYYFDTENDEYGTEQKLRLACENWDSPFVITTSVQFFQSLYHYKGSSLRKLHNMAESVIVFDEIHLLPVELLQPCLRGVGYITKYLGSKALFLSATMPDHSKLFEEYLPSCSYRELIVDKTDFCYYKKCRYTYLGKTDIENVLSKAEGYRSVLIVVISRKTARAVYSLLSGNKYHLSTYMTPNDRSVIIEKIRKDLENCVPIRVVSTSLIEAGVDLDFETVFRQLAGLDSILQSGGRCNREGKRENADVFIFETDEKSRGDMALRTEITSGLLAEYEDITSVECIREYYNRLIYNKHNAIARNSIADKEYCPSGDFRSIQFRKYSENINFINDDTVAVVIDNCDDTKELLESYYDDPRAIRRKLQRYSIALKYINEFLPMLETGRLEERYKNLFVLTDNEDYSSETGILLDRTNDYIV
ncbi:MAG: CRISPR-associated helicase Cas3' [Ruminococcus sp.]|uniref:CRISPR-associated helicase Cas3' n=1 Tax=Ruminococcus sp. TaxID=41978 RepID=UPI0025F13FAA|nr:CRISPR-associated helicase Cas3' [Ruminococcus sp.]MCR5540876.1 CRISPR-associated helicase Cas3' [Ruminococcus sp.]